MPNVALRQRDKLWQLFEPAFKEAFKATDSVIVYSAMKHALLDAMGGACDGTVDHMKAAHDMSEAFAKLKAQAITGAPFFHVQS